MKISYKWLLELTGLNWSVDDVENRLTLCGTACEYVDSTSQYMDNVIVAEVVDLQPIKGADKIRLATVNTGDSTMDVVCGAPNVAVGQKIVLAQLGAKLAGGMEIKKAKIRGVESCGMICSERELGMSEDHSGIMVLDKDATLGKPLVEYLDYDDYMLTFELTPNRPDSMCAMGLARDMAALDSVKLIIPEFELTEVEDSAADQLSVRIEDPDACPRYAARIIRGVKVEPSPWWVRKKLLTAGMRPVSNIVDITNLVMLECGHPLHAFDYDRFGSKEVVVRRAKDGEEFTTLDDNKHKLTNDVLMITNGKTSVAAGGVMGGLDSEVEDSTTNILLEAAYFDAPTIRKSRKHLGFVTESSTRFEKGADPQAVIYALNRAAYLFQAICGGQVQKGIVDCYPKVIDPLTISFRPKRCNDILGTSISTDRMKQIFIDLEFEVDGDDPLQVTVPTFRPDIEREIDLIEEVVRIEGYDAVEDAITNVGPLFTRILPDDKFRREARTVLTAAGFDEMLHHGLAHSKLADKLHPGLPQVKLANTSSAELDIMRNSLLESALDVLRHNISHRNLDLRLFEIGKVYFPGKPEDSQWPEEERLLIAITGQTERTWRDKPRDLDFYDLTGALSNLARHFGWSSFEYKPGSTGWLDSSLSYKVCLDGKAIGWIGQLSSKTGKIADIKQKVIAAELTLVPLIKAQRGLYKFTPLPVYPAALRDLALVVDSSVQAGVLVELIKKTAGKLAESVEIFDLYEGKQIEQGKKSIAIAIKYRSLDKSLSSEEVDKLQSDVINRLKRDFNAEVRAK